jgi:hypothetical protein
MYFLMVRRDVQWTEFLRRHSDTNTPYPELVAKYRFGGEWASVFFYGSSGNFMAVGG